MGCPSTIIQPSKDSSSTKRAYTTTLFASRRGRNGQRISSDNPIDRNILKDTTSSTKMPQLAYGRDSIFHPDHWSHHRPRREQPWRQPTLTSTYDAVSTVSRQTVPIYRQQQLFQWLLIPELSRGTRASERRSRQAIFTLLHAGPSRRWVWCIIGCLNLLHRHTAPRVHFLWHGYHPRGRTQGHNRTSLSLSPVFLSSSSQPASPRHHTLALVAVAPVLLLVWRSPWRSEGASRRRIMLCRPFIRCQICD